jgi:hypothetical protein
MVPSVMLDPKAIQAMWDQQDQKGTQAILGHKAWSESRVQLGHRDPLVQMERMVLTVLLDLLAQIQLSQDRRVIQDQPGRRAM